jgi:hypothetical protein
VTIKSRAIAALKRVPRQGELLRLSKQIDLSIKIWKVRIEADPTLSEAASADLLSMIRTFVRTATTLKNMPYTEALAEEVARKLIKDER